MHDDIEQRPSGRGKPSQVGANQFDNSLTLGKSDGGQVNSPPGLVGDVNWHHVAVGKTDILLVSPGAARGTQGRLAYPFGDTNGLFEFIEPNAPFVP